MRVTTRLMSNSYLRNLNRQTSKVQKYQHQLSSLKEVSKPSDDPLTVSKIMDLNNSIVQNDYYQTTIEDAIDWTNVQDAALGQATNALGRIQTLIQSAANGTMSGEDHKAIKHNIEGEIGALVDALNTNFGGRYVFGGRDTTKKPFEVDKDDNGNMTISKYENNEQNLPREVSPGVTVDLLTDGNKLVEVEGDADDEGFNLNTFFSKVLTTLDSDKPEELKKLGEGLLETANSAYNNIVDKRAEVGSVFNRLEAAKSRNETESLNLKSMLSNKEDIDLAEKYMEYSMEMIAYESSLQMGTRILQTNILNYL